MLNPNFPKNALSTTETFLKNVAKIKAAEFSKKLVTLDLAQMSSASMQFQKEINTLTADKQVPKEFAALYHDCLLSYAYLTTALEFESIHYFPKLSEANTITKNAFFAYKQAMKQLEKLFLKALEVEMSNLEQTAQELKAAILDFGQKQVLATYSFDTGHDGSVAPDASSTNDDDDGDEPRFPPENVNYRYTAVEDAIHRFEMKKQEAAENARKEEKRREKENQDSIRSALESEKRREEELEQQKSEEQKKIKSNEEARARMEEHARTEKKIMEFLAEPPKRSLPRFDILAARREEERRLAEIQRQKEEEEIQRKQEEEKARQVESEDRWCNYA